ncbi:alpha/beta hydrolase [Microbulbifer sp. OS29]|uniref:Alpha/beta hydrolase n=1 Tax=Microbulbifer okhotskensis TaxID=2926617 RepID=A0A9X2EVS7_9GAMM|nr:alpha/beta hydrolase [Microbulbifer okhotskensis]MCO1336378.1 alpha/beta hydrolase [Microbulbifer okhotskensis]
MFKTLTVCIASLLGLVVVAASLWSRTTQPLSGQVKQVIRDTLASPLPQMVTGDAGFARSGDIDIWYESKLPEDRPYQSPKGTVLLINGLGSSALFWPPEVYDFLLKAGYRVVLSDHRGCGGSGRVEDWSEKTAYSLKDMADDNLAVLDALGIQQAHILGLSLGGMIGQEIAIRYPNRVKSLSSVMSTGFSEDPDLPRSSAFKYGALKLFLRYGLVNSEENMAMLVIGTYNLLKGDREIDVEHLTRATLYELRHRKGFDHRLPGQQATAISLSGSRYDALSSLTVPTLVVHGVSDPLLNISHAKKYAGLIPSAQTLWVDGMGHALAPAYIEAWMGKVVQFIDMQR